MDFSIIDELYDIYINENLIDAKNKFTNYYKQFEEYGNHDFVKEIKNYINQQTKKISTFYISDKDNNQKVKNIVKDITTAFETIKHPVQSFILNRIYKDSDPEEIKYDYTINHKEITPNDLFSVNLKLMKRAVKKDASFYFAIFKKVKAIIEYVKQEKLLETIYSDGSWREMNFSELIECLYDKAEDKSVFEVNFDGIYDYEETLFGTIKENCSKISTIEFDKYRSKFISTKQINVEYGKLIFCRNLLEFYNSGIMPTIDGLLDCSIDFYDSLNLEEDFKRLYSKKFDDKEFREAQSNFICNPEIITTDYELKYSKKVNFNNRLIIGHLITGNCALISSSNYEIPYLIHIDIKDINNPCSTYEIQLNLIPQADISNRLQLMRFDNWGSKGKHKNLGNKLDTTTHIHLYNQFDLIRGKDNGEFQIIYNFENKSTEFETAFETFLDILDLNSDLKLKIYNKTIKAIEKLKESSKSIDI